MTSGVVAEQYWGVSEVSFQNHPKQISHVTGMKINVNFPRAGVVLHMLI